jgi:hypothetical protein
MSPAAPAYCFFVTAPAPQEATLARGVLLAPHVLGWPRMALAMGASLAAAAAMATVALGFLLEVGWCEATLLLWLEATLLLLAGVTIVLDRVGVHVFARAILWGGFTLGALVSQLGLIVTWALFGGSGIALLALGAAGLDRKDGVFAPRVLRRTLLAMTVVGVYIAHLLFVAAVTFEPITVSIVDEFALEPSNVSIAIELPSSLFTRAGTFVTPLLLVFGAIGLSRTRSWGLIAYLSAVVGMALTCASAAFWFAQLELGTPNAEATLYYLSCVICSWSLAAIVLFVVALPMIAALVFRRRPKPEGRTWGSHLHAAIVLLVAACVLWNALA